MNQEQIYDLLWKKLEPFGGRMDIEERTELDGAISELSVQLAKEISCARETSKV